MGARQGTTYDKDGDRWYKDPTNATTSYAGVSGVLATRNKPFLAKAKVNGVAKYAAHNRKSLAEMTQAVVTAILRDQDSVLPDWKAKREFGTAAHQVLDNYLSGRPLGEGVDYVEGTQGFPVENDFTEWVVSHWLEFTAEHDVEVIGHEETVFNDSLSFAGSYDLLLRVDGKLTIVDTKTNAGGPTGDVSLQLTAYAHANRIVDMTTGESRDMPKVEQAAVLWLQPKGWAFAPVRFDDVSWKVFYGLLLAFQWTKMHDADAVGAPVSGTIEFPHRWTN